MVETRKLTVILPLVIVVFDQLTKAVVRAKLPLHESVTVIPGLIDFTHVRTTGAAVGFLEALVGVGMYAASLAHHQLAARSGLALIIGGAAGNLIDRVTAGSVVDFVDVYWRNWHFWAFNVADSAITIGVAIMILDMITPDAAPAPTQAD